ncbi:MULTISPECIES: hypothetical protein [Amycolatopsis]|uniref:Uncharacterized protein n=1 Tax=Amycolatopsis bullii TaxID=941987 RepID=A0ABQ3KGA7_9PSEU|nr:hypothetical protein [Amycolatopsis bullii]GHG14295.1 hypothetical protein GCM10017567_35030 [Amycolatopsis bullii]
MRTQRSSSPEVAASQGSAPVRQLPGLIGLQQAAGNRAVSGLLVRTRQADAGRPGDVPVQRVLSWCGKPVAAYEDVPEEDRNQITTALERDCGKAFGEFARMVIGAMIDDPGRYNVPDKGAAGIIVKNIKEMLHAYSMQDLSKISSNNNLLRIVERLLENEKHRGDLESKNLKTSRAGLVSARNIRKFNELLNKNPKFVDYLKKAGIKISFSSSDARNLGSLYVHDSKTVHLSPEADEASPGVFLRLLLHEMGHASFERMLMNTDLRILNEDGRVFHDAWTVLRRNDGRYMFGLDLGYVGTPDARKVYQAQRFEEFCAESFMYRVTESDLLKRHVNELNEPSKDVPQDIRDAWSKAIVILDKYAPLILG